MPHSRLNTRLFVLCSQRIKRMPPTNEESLANLWRKVAFNRCGLRAQGKKVVINLWVLYCLQTFAMAAAKCSFLLGGFHGGTCMPVSPYSFYFCPSPPVGLGRRAIVLTVLFLTFIFKVLSPCIYTDTTLRPQHSFHVV